MGWNREGENGWKEPGIKKIDNLEFENERELEEVKSKWELGRVPGNKKSRWQPETGWLVKGTKKIGDY